MAFNNYYAPGYAPGYYAPPMQDHLAQLRQQQYQPQQMQPQRAQTAPNGVDWVQGEEAAKARMIPAGSSMLLLDSESDTFYLKSADASGMPLPLRIFDYKERISAPKPMNDGGGEYVTRAEFSALEARLNAIMQSNTELEETEYGEHTV